MLLTAMVAALSLGTLTTPWPAVYQGFLALFTGAPVTGAAQVVADLRAPRVLVAVGVGAALAAAGAAFQSLFRNPLASPDLLGVSSGAGLGAVVAIMVGASGIAIQASAFTGGLATVAIVYALATRLRAGDPLLTLVLLGVVIGSLLASLIALAKNLADPYQQLPTITYWLMGSLAGSTINDAWLVLLLAAAAIAVLALLAWRVNLLTLSDDEAQSLGVSLAQLRLTVIVAATLASAAAVAAAGIIGWVGLIVPHAARLLVGAHFRRVLPVAVILGATFMVCVDLIGRGATRIEIAPGIVTALVGAPVFLLLLRRQQRRGGA